MHGILDVVRYLSEYNKVFKNRTGGPIFYKRKLTHLSRKDIAPFIVKNRLTAA